MQIRAVNPSYARHWPSLVALVVMALFTYWASIGLWSPPAAISGKRPHLPDVSIENFSARKLDNKGSVQYAVSASSLIHYSDDGSAQASNIRFVSHLPGKPQLTAKAPTGVLRTGPSGEEEVELTGGVDAESTVTEKVPATQMHAPNMVLYPDRMLAQANQGVTLSSASGHASADRMVLDGDSGKIRLVNAVATFERMRR